VDNPGSSVTRVDGRSTSRLLKNAVALPMLSVLVVFLRSSTGS
jgi:hypothetical protein